MTTYGTISTAFQFCPRCGAKSESAGKNPFACTACDFHYYFSPAVAVAGFVTDGTDRLLFLRRARDPGKGMLGLPGGFVDPGETMEQAMHREAIEEVQLPLTSMEYLVSYPNLYHFQGVDIPVTDVFFSCMVDSFDNLVRQEDEVADTHICQPTQQELDAMAFPSNRKALELYLARRQ